MPFRTSTMQTQNAHHRKTEDLVALLDFFLSKQILHYFERQWSLAVVGRSFFFFKRYMVISDPGVICNRNILKYHGTVC